MENTDTLKLYVKHSNPNILGIDMYTREKNTLNSWELNLMDLQQDDIEIPPIKFESVITMKSAHFQKICRDMFNFSEKIEIQSVGSELSFKGCNINIKQETRVKPTPDGMKYIQNDNPTEVIQGIFDLKFLVLFSKCTNLSNDIHIHIKNNYPLVLKVDLMIIAHRTYQIRHGMNKTYVKLFEEIGLPIQLKHLGNLLAYFETAIGPVNEVVHLWGYESLADMELRRAKRDADPDWNIYKEKSAGMLLNQTNKILCPTHFSPLK